MTESVGFYKSGNSDLPHIMILDDSEYIHYPASPDDVWAVLQKLPTETLQGIPIIDYRLESGKPDEDADDHEASFPPIRRETHTGRIGIELLPGIHAAFVAGSLIPLTHRIVLTAYVYDPALTDREMWECYLRFRMLSVLMHEVGHHVDLATRRLPSHGEHHALEQTAETYEARWARDIVIPYLREQYASGVQMLEAWASEWAGHAITLDDCIDTPRALPEDPSWAAAWRLIPPSKLISHLAYAVSQGKSRDEVQDWYVGYLEWQQLR